VVAVGLTRNERLNSQDIQELIRGFYEFILKNPQMAMFLGPFIYTTTGKQLAGNTTRRHSTGHPFCKITL
jgi:hypothetical protein